MAGEKSPDFECGQILFSLKMSRLNYLVKETPYSAYITNRKTFTRENKESQTTFVSLNTSDKEVELLDLKERNKDLETRARATLTKTENCADFDKIWWRCS